MRQRTKTGLCRTCFLSVATMDKTTPVADRAAALQRKLAGTPTAEDLIRDEATHLRNALSTSQALVKKFEAQATLDDRLLREVHECIEKNPYRPRFTKPPRTKASPEDHEIMAVVSDAHFPEVVDPKAAFGLTYNAEVCRRRMQYLRDKILRYRALRASSYPVRKITLAVLGDMLSGTIHEELEVTNEMPMTSALVEMAYMLHDLGTSIAAEVEEVEMVVLPGNHPRLTKKPRFKNKWDNWETVMGHFVRALAGDRFAVTVPEDLVYRHKIFDFTVGLTHGDGIKAPSAFGMPWYSMKRKQDALQSLLKSLGLDQIDLLAYGHFHQLVFMEGQGCSLFVNGSIKGGDEFSLGTGYSNQEPVQGLLTFHKKHGITDVSRINLGHVR